MLLIDDLFIIAFLLLIFLCIAALIKKEKVAKMLLWCGVYMYAILVLGLTLFPIPYEAAKYLTSVPHNFIPFQTIIAALSGGLTKSALIQIGGNIIIAIPYGMLVFFFQKKQSIIRTILLAILFPTVIETLQYIIGCYIGVIYCSFDIDDFILNAAGACFGSAITICVPSKIHHKIYSKCFE